MPARMILTHPLCVAAAAAAVALLAVGCGGTSPQTSSTAAQAPKDPGAAAHQYATCMRNHGVTNFPDPVVHESTSGGSTQVAVGIRVTPAITGSPAFKSASKACGHILPGAGGNGPSPAQQRAKAQALLAFARCLRSHGENGFPDPNAQGQLSLQQIQAAGIDIHAPGFLTAAKACVGVTHGMITGAQVVQAINGPH